MKKLKRPKTFIKAIDNLINRYTKLHKSTPTRNIKNMSTLQIFGILCPFCIASFDYHKRAACDICPYVSIDKACSNKEFYQCEFSLESSCSLRIKRLRRWKRIYLKQLKLYKNQRNGKGNV